VPTHFLVNDVVKVQSFPSSQAFMLQHLQNFILHIIAILQVSRTHRWNKYKTKPKVAVIEYDLKKVRGRDPNVQDIHGYVLVPKKTLG